MKKISKIRDEFKELKESFEQLRRKELSAIKTSLVFCPICSEKIRFGSYTFIQAKYYVRPFSYTGVDYWVDEETQFCFIVCQKCNEQTRIYDHPQKKEIIYMLGQRAFAAKQIFCKTETINNR